MPKPQTRIGGWTRHNCLDEKPEGLKGFYELAWFDPNESDERNVGFSTMFVDRDADGISPAWDHVFAYRKVEL